MSSVSATIEQPSLVRQLFENNQALIDALDRLLGSRRRWIFAAGGIFALQIALIATHSAWLDEWQALLIAWQSPTLPDLLSNLRYEGHPPLWYLILRGLAGVLPFDMILAAVSATMAIATQSIILFRAPFARSERFLLATGEIVLFEYGVMARSLALGVLVTLLVLWLWKRRLVWFPIALLPLCDFQFGVISLAFVSLLIRERRLDFAGMLLWCALSIAAAWATWPAPDIYPAEKGLTAFAEISDFIQRLGTLLVPFQMMFHRPAWDAFAPFLTGSLLSIPLLIWLWRRTREDQMARAIQFGFIAICAVLTLTIYPLHFRHLTLIMWVTVILTWLAPPHLPDPMWKLWLTIGSICGIMTASLALVWNFDAAPRAAQIIRAIDDGKHPWLAFPVSRIPSLYANTHMRFVEPERGCVATFARWNFAREIDTEMELSRALPEWARIYGRSFIVLDSMPRYVPDGAFRPLSPILRDYNGQTYVIGLLGADQPIRRLDIPDCLPGLRPIT